MKRETALTIVGALLAEADAALLEEIKGLVFWRGRELRSEQIQQYEVGDTIRYRSPQGNYRSGRVAQLNRFSVSLRHYRDDGSWTTEVVPAERILGLWIESVDPETHTPALASQGGQL